MGNTPIIERTVVTAVTPVLHTDKQWTSGVMEDLQWNKHTSHLRSAQRLNHRFLPTKAGC
ncbi:hypothetical protein DV515_00004950 [Chloebia gouldiae]|uniref:Uncharacterized protein n=1 Tax=Chloebia gouldiae TaxID=44316 RepID=A0A3L8SR30_CHLGU|nr:hypothetical protein DV515_00004950 [Chloebia gouldiae]